MDLKRIFSPFKSTAEVTPEVKAPPTPGVAPKSVGLNPEDLPETPAPKTGVVQDALPTRTAAELHARRGNFAAIMSAQKAGLQPKESLASISALTRGEAFGVKNAEAMQRITGHNITRAGLENLYGSVLPDTHAFVSNLKLDRYTGALDFSVKWLDNEGQLVAKLNRRLARHEDGDVELYSHGCWVEPSHRSRAVSAAVMQKEIDLLKNLSAHPRTRMSLWAGGMRDPNNPENFQPIGAYVWATMGFDCAQQHGPRSKLPRGGANKKRCELEVKAHWEVPDFDFAKLMFGQWLARAEQEGLLPKDPELLAGLKEAVDKCHNMWSLATLQVPGLEVEVDVGGRKTSCHVGKAFLLSDEAPRWEGVFLANGGQENFHALAQEYCEPRIEKAQANFHQTQQALAQVLDGDDLAAKLQALATVAKSGDISWKDTLQALADSQPELAEAAQSALKHIQGDRLTEALGEQSRDPRAPVSDRLEALDLAIRRDPGGRQALLESLVQAPQTGPDFEVARAALNRLARGKVEGPHLLGLLGAVYERALNQPEVADPYAGRGGYSKSHFQQKAETRQAIIGHLRHLEGEGASAQLLQIVRTDPNWEVGAEAMDAWITRAVGARPEPILDEAQAFLQRARGRHAELKAQDKSGDLMNRISRARSQVLKSMAQLPSRVVASALEQAMDAEPYYDGVRAALESLATVLGDEDPARVARSAEHWLKTATNSYTMRRDCVAVLQGLPQDAGAAALVRAAKTETDNTVLWALSRALKEAGPGHGAEAALHAVHARLDAQAREAEARRAAEKR